MKNDLLQINTLTPNDVANLHAIGITKLEDIAQLDKEAIMRVTTQLNLLEGRIEFEYWIEQAQDHIYSHRGV